MSPFVIIAWICALSISPIFRFDRTCIVSECIFVCVWDFFRIGTAMIRIIRIITRAISASMLKKTAFFGFIGRCRRMPSLVYFGRL